LLSTSGMCYREQERHLIVGVSDSHQQCTSRREGIVVQTNLR